MIRMNIAIFRRFRFEGETPASTPAVEILWDDLDELAFDDGDWISWD